MIFFRFFIAELLENNLEVLQINVNHYIFTEAYKRIINKNLLEELHENLTRIFIILSPSIFNTNHRIFENIYELSSKNIYQSFSQNVFDPFLLKVITILS